MLSPSKPQNHTATRDKFLTNSLQPPTFPHQPLKSTTTVNFVLSAEQKEKAVSLSNNMRVEGQTWVGGGKNVCKWKTTELMNVLHMCREQKVDHAQRSYPIIIKGQAAVDRNVQEAAESQRQSERMLLT